MRAADAFRIVEPGIGEAALLQIFDAALRMLDHVFLGAEIDRLGRAGLGAGRSLSDGHPVRAERAFIGLVVHLGDARNVEGATLHAIAAADAVLRDEVDDAVLILHDGSGSRAGLEAARILAMHAAILADQPFQIALLVEVLGVAHQRPGVLGQVMRVVIDTHIDADLLLEIVPLKAGDLAGFAADAFRHVDELGHFDRGLAHAWRRLRGCGAAAEVKRLICRHLLASPSFAACPPRGSRRRVRLAVWSARHPPDTP